MERKVVRLPVMMEPRMVQSIDDWSFSNRVRTRAGAVRELIRRGLNSPPGAEEGEASVKRTREES